MMEKLSRGKSVDTGEWIHGDYGREVVHTDNGGVEHLYREGEYMLHYIVPLNESGRIVDEETIGQSIGKIDANYILVFDGDRLKRDGMWPMRVLGIRVVPDDDVQRANCVPSRCKGIDEFDFREWEVFGNIHDKEAAK